MRYACFQKHKHTSVFHMIVKNKEYTYENNELIQAYDRSKNP